MKTDIFSDSLKNETETSNQQLIFVLAAFSFHILICIFLLNPNFTLFWGLKLESQVLDIIPARLCLGLTWESGWSSGWQMGWIPRGYSSLHSWACRCLHRVCCLGLAMHRDSGKVLCTFLCAELGYYNEVSENFYWEMSYFHADSKHQSLPAGIGASAQSVKAQKVQGGLQPINPNNSAGFLVSFLTLCFFLAEHRLHQPVQQLCPRPAAVLPRCWALLVASEGGLLPHVPGHQGLRGQLPRAQRALRLPHGGLRGLDQSYNCHPQVAGSQVQCIVNQPCQWDPWIRWFSCF